MSVITVYRCDHCNLAETTQAVKLCDWWVHDYGDGERHICPSCEDEILNGKVKNRDKVLSELHTKEKRA